MNGWTQADIDAYRRKKAAGKAVLSPVGKAIAKAFEDAKPTDQAEADLQAAAEYELAVRGYMRMTAAHFDAVAARGAINGAGFYGHLVEARKNPLLPDLFVIAWPNVRPMLMIELKTRDVWQPGQNAAVRIGLWKVAWSVEDVKRLVDEWDSPSTASSARSAATR